MVTSLSENLIYDKVYKLKVFKLKLFNALIFFCLLTLSLPWGQFDPNHVFKKFLLFNRLQQRYETSRLLFYMEEVC